MFHVYRTKYVIYKLGFEKVTKGNREIIGNVWHEHFIVGATQTQTTSRTELLDIQRVAEVEDDQREVSSDTDPDIQDARNPRQFLREQEYRRTS